MMQNSNQLQSYYNQSNNQQQIFDGNMLQFFVDRNITENFQSNLITVNKIIKNKC